MARFLVGPRACGKTTELAKWAQESPDHVIVTAHDELARRLIRDYGLNRDQVIPARSRDRLRGRRVKLGVDDAEIVLSILLGCEVEFVTATGETVAPRVPEAVL